MKKNIIVASIIALTAMCVATGCTKNAPNTPQTQTTTQNITANNMIPPQITPPEPFKTQTPKAFTLDNGIKLWVIHNNILPLTAIRITNHAGAAYDPENKAGLAAYTAAMLREGANKNSAFQISDIIEKTGASLSTHTSNDASGITLEVLTPYLDNLLTTVADIYTNPDFPEAEFDKLKNIITNGITQRNNKPDYIAKLIATKRFFGTNHPYAMPNEGTIETIQNIQLEDIKNFYKYYAPEHTDIIAVTDLEPSQLRDALNNKLGMWKPESKPLPELNFPETTHENQLVIVDKPGAPQSVIRITLPGPKNTDPQLLKCRWMNIPFGGSFTGRLMQNIREDKGYTYGAYANFVPLEYDGYFIASASVATDVTGPALAEFIHEFNRLPKKDFSQDELTRAKSTWQANYVQSIENRMGLVNLFTGMITSNLPLETVNQFSEKLPALTLEDLNNTAASLPAIKEKALILIVGDKEQILPQLKELNLPDPVYELMP